MNFQSYFLWLIILILSLSPCVITLNVQPKSRRCLEQCLEYCKNESLSGIPSNLCDNVCLTMCYSARRDVGSADINLDNDK